MEFFEQSLAERMAMARRVLALRNGHDLRVHWPREAQWCERATYFWIKSRAWFRRKAKEATEQAEFDRKEREYEAIMRKRNAQLRYFLETPEGTLGVLRALRTLRPLDLKALAFYCGGGVAGDEAAIGAHRKARVSMAWVYQRKERALESLRRHPELKSWLLDLQSDPLRRSG